ncbi:class I SAM-dependent methyltransferase [Paremcibacter congregatus]|uniref:class I SAM-dependent methyltransferase n=1 Tax=Paremcibacter congregatus TaxID=2043170 RepID=UPI003A9276FF
MILLNFFLKKLIQEGTLHVIDVKGRTYSYRGTATPEVTIRLHDRWLPFKIFLKPDLRPGEAIMDGTLTIENGKTVFDFLNLVTKNMEWRRNNPMHFTGGDPYSRFKSWISQINPAGRSRQNVAHHYDLSGKLYDLFLDADRQYSCAYFRTPEDTLEQAQENKKSLIAAKLLLDKHHKVLDIGCGWGGLALHINQTSGAHVTGVTLSKEQYDLACKRAEDRSVSDMVQFKFQDYRSLTEKFDRVVSVGMFEHVGRRQYKTYFDKVYDSLTDDGVALIHTIGRADGPGSTDPWTLKYIFPGGYAPSLSEIAPIIEKSGLYITDMEVWRLHYADTLREWRLRTYKNRDAIVELYDERFFRMWDFYLSSAECAFRHLGHVVFQLQLAKRQDAVPLTREYLLQDTDIKQEIPPLEPPLKNVANQ